MIIYLEDKYSPNKCVMCLNPITIKYILHVSPKYWIESIFDVTNQQYYGYCSKKCQDCASSIDIEKITQWKRLPSEIHL